MPTNKISLPDYKTAPPIGGTAFSWFKFFFAPVRKEYTFCLFINIVRQAFFRSQPLFLGILVGLAENGTLKSNPKLAVYWMITYITLSMCAYFSILYLLPKAGRVMDRFSKHISLFAFRHYLNLSESWHENRASGEKLQRLLKARDSSFSLLEDTMWHLVQFPAIAISVFVSIYYLKAGWYYIPLFYCMIASYIWFSHHSGHWLKSRYARYYKTQEDVVGSVYEFLSSTSTVRYFNLRNHIQGKAKKFETINYQERTALFKTSGMRWLLLDTLALFLDRQHLFMCHI